MRILIYGINFAPELTGIGKYTGEMAAFLAEKGHFVRVITAPPYYPQWQVQPGYSGWKFQKENWQGVTVYRCPLWLPGNGRKPLRINGFERILHHTSFALSSLPAVLAQIRWRPERIIVLAPSILNAPAAALLARLVNGKSWLHIQDFELDAALRLKMLPGLSLIMQIALKAECGLYRSFDRVSTISNRMVDFLRLKGANLSQIVLFPNWVDTHQIYPISGYNDLRQELHIDDACLVVLYSGNMGQKQGLEVLVEAARILQNESRLLFLLCGEGSVKSQLEAQASRLPNLRFLPLQANNRLNKLLNLADIHVLPQSAFAADLVMPSKLTGMLASGRPVIVTSLPGTELANVMEPLGWVIPPERADLLAEAILSLADQPEMRAEFGRRGRAFAEQTWDKETILERFMETLQIL